MRFRRNSRMTSEVSTGSLNDIMFFLMLFFLIVSTLVNPSVIKLMLPKSQAGQSVSKQNITISVDAQKNFFVNDKPVRFEEVEPSLAEAISGKLEPTVVLRADNNLPVQVIVDVISIGNKLKVKMVLATENK